MRRGVFSLPINYLTAELHRNAQCYCLFIEGEPVAFAGMLYRPHPKVRDIWGLSRLVTLPDFQGLGLAFVLTDTLASAFRAVGLRFHTYPAHPALIRAFDRSTSWNLELAPRMRGKSHTKHPSIGTFGGRPNAVFAYVGPAMEDRATALDLLDLRMAREAEA